MIFVKNLKSVSDQKWSSTEKYPGVRWKFLIDADFTGSSGLSLGFVEIAPGGGDLPPPIITHLQKYMRLLVAKEY